MGAILLPSLERQLLSLPSFLHSICVRPEEETMTPPTQEAAPRVLPPAPARAEPSVRVVIDHAQGAAPKSRYLGLCSTCVTASTCSYTRDPRRPVWECDEYVCHETPLAAIPRRSASPASSQDETEPAEQNGSEHMGLCATCAGRETCSFHKPEGGVWRCEEYR